MSSRFSYKRHLLRVCPPILFLILAAATMNAQTLPTKSSPAPQPSPSPSLESRFFKNLLHDERAMWSSPARLRGGDLKWIVPLGISTAVLIRTDSDTARALRDDPTRLKISCNVSRFGALYSGGALAAAFYLTGRRLSDARMRETGVLGAEALVNGQIVSLILKAATQRQRPRADTGRGRFFTRGNSFPSGHAINSWALATVIAHEYGDSRLIKITSYTIATLVSISRFTGRNHFLSDILVGSAMGYGIGRFVYKAHHDPTLGPYNTDASQHRRLRLFLYPQYNTREHVYGIALSLSF